MAFNKYLEKVAELRQKKTSRSKGSSSAKLRKTSKPKRTKVPVKASTLSSKKRSSNRYLDKIKKSPATSFMSGTKDLVKAIGTPYTPSDAPGYQYTYPPSGIPY